MTWQPFPTGQDHQAAVAAWARQRLADRGGARFDDGTGRDRPRQIGCLFADGVGLGKTWEALASVALLLARRDSHNRAQRRRGGAGKHLRRRARRAHVLVLVPPGLVAKWMHELEDPQGFPKRLQAWARRRGREFVARTLGPEACYRIRRRGDLDDLPRGRINRGRYVLPKGTYVCNWNVLLGPGGPGRDRLSALRAQKWEVVVVDEAHHGAARRALARLRAIAPRLLLTATPFQLDVAELHGITRGLLEAAAGSHRVLKRGAVREYVRATSAAFAGGSPPAGRIRRDAQRVLGQLIASCNVRGPNRSYFAIGADGAARPVPSPAVLDTEPSLAQVLGKAIEPSPAYQAWYVAQRMCLARRELALRPKHVAMELRKVLSIGRGAPSHPKRDALASWARRQFVDDLRDALRDGRPRKLLVFTQLRASVVGPLRTALEQALVEAHKEVARQSDWQAARRRAYAALERLTLEVVARGGDSRKEQARLRAMLKRLRGAIEGTLYFDLLGCRDYEKRVVEELRLLVAPAPRGERLSRSEGEELGAARWHRHQALVKRAAADATLATVVRAPLSERFTGEDARGARDVVAEAFKTALGPWILVATNVGSEGIDLHRYSRHLVHYDLEWNPARLEQREGRIDRLGRELPEPARIHYLLVRGTYDERMLHQLVARQRWHHVFLGRRELRRASDEAHDTPWITVAARRRLSLDLDPRTGGSG